MLHHIQYIPHSFVGLAAQSSGAAVSLPGRINWLSEGEEEEHQASGQR